MNKFVWRSGALLTAIGISSSAFGSHGLKSYYPSLSDNQLSSWSTASNYLIYNGLGLLVLSLHPNFTSSTISIPNTSITSSEITNSSTKTQTRSIPSFRIAANMILFGSLTFSGTIFGLVLNREKLGKILGPLTPIGGSLMIAGLLSFHCPYIMLIVFFFLSSLILVCHMTFITLFHHCSLHISVVFFFPYRIVLFSTMTLVFIQF
ncbi:hypothetical protein TREMEDRAFT_45099 [Tremella mesenterica DSM 1558]|uniref:uncharacterized protein n=1 Tax=Tremella mesenterica (strain ATCC 24925 / CBS 8224 / DSM 1558 / NBRC 9311 / NRRL Y-6157 / RJB 2259-6 / UBC 559-6) TaxID=578456 RepID=UPI0003F49A38|nr:uncharacterized protein TREMEDRAFT_45099 [Tremella mesenterica DSM 1558]EIW67473.1 hypothetical protein TREMEDRAFT_45099 [Tremella mesenterica DSM 1558]